MRRPTPACRPAVETARRMAPLVRGEVAALSVRQGPENACPMLAFKDASGSAQDARRLARPDRAVEPVGDLVRALPQGDAGARRACRPSSAAPDFEVVRSTSTPATADKPKAWLKEVGIDALGYYADNSAKVFQDLKAVGKAFGMPTTLLIDPQRLRARDAGGTGRMGERRRAQARHRGARQDAKITQTEISRLPPMPLATLARRLEILLRRFEQLGGVGRGVRIHPQHLGRHRGLQLRRLRGNEGCGDRGDVHTRYSLQRVAADRLKP